MLQANRFKTRRIFGEFQAIMKHVCYYEAAFSVVCRLTEPSKGFLRTWYSGDLQLSIFLVTVQSRFDMFHYVPLCNSRFDYVCQGRILSEQTKYDLTFCCTLQACQIILSLAVFHLHKKNCCKFLKCTNFAHQKQHFPLKKINTVLNKFGFFTLFHVLFIIFIFLRLLYYFICIFIFYFLVFVS